MIKDLVSVIVPVFNVERYLKSCLNSILNQTYSNIEIILVNDGSKDCSGAICDEYAKNDSRIKVIHKENGGVSKARNTGLDIAQGEFVTFIDGDDTVDPDYISLMHHEMVCNDFDVVRLSWERGGVNFTYPVKFDKEGKCVIDGDSLNDLHLCANIWGLFKTSLNIRFNENLKNGEDSLFVIENFVRSNKRMLLMDRPYYHYTIVVKSASEMSATERLIAHKKFLDQVLLLKNLYSHIEFLAKKHAYSDNFSVMCDMINKNIKSENGFELNEIQKVVIELRHEGAKYTGFKEELKYLLYRYRLISIFRILKKASKIIGR